MWEIVLCLTPLTVAGFLLLCAVLPWAAVALQARTREVVPVLSRALLVLCLLVVLAATLFPDQSLGSGGQRYVIWLPGEGLWGGRMGTFGMSDTERDMILRLQLVNALMFVPLGLLLVLASRQPCLGRAVLTCLALSLLIEAAQYAMNAGRTVDIDDVLFNTLGGILGGLLAYLPHRMLTPASQPRHAQ
ncbi:VanZ family protein [Streptomyces sp. NPDC102340]|uniref:VanZ family protein n=1 Tax=unclassified Streptomyces TaxID=2593676 RepID=UPI003809FDB8